MRTLGPDYPHLATSLNDLAVLYKVQGKYAAAEPLYQWAVAVWERNLGPNIAGLYKKMGRKGEPKRSSASWTKRGPGMRLASLTRGGVRTRKEEAVAVEQAKGDQRRHPRWGVRGRLTGRVGSIPQVAVVDISLGGALIEHPSLFQPGAVMIVNLLFPGYEVGLKCRVIRSDPHGYEVLPTGTRDLLHRTGLEFLDVSETSQRVINGYIRFLSQLQL